MADKARQITPVYGENVQSNQKTILYIRSITSLAIGIGAGILQLESYYGFLFYVAFSVFIGILHHFVVAGGKPREYFLSPVSDLWTGELLLGLSSFILTWTLFYDLVDA